MLKKKNPFRSLTLLLPALFLIIFYQSLEKNVYLQNNKSLKNVAKERKFNKVELIENGSRKENKVALTFDADLTYGMLDLLREGVVKSWYNNDVINTLSREKVKATVFLTGLWTVTYPNEARAIAKNPLFEIGNHSYSHPGFTDNCYQLPFVLDKMREYEISKAEEVIKNITQITPKYFRFPGGCYDKLGLKNVSKFDLQVVGWDVVSGDAFNNDASQIIGNVESNVQNGSIIVFHVNGGPDAPKTNDALIKIIPYLRSKGFKFVTISEMFPG